MIILDGIRGNLERFGGVIAITQRYRLGIQPDGHRQGLEHRTQLVNPFGGPVEYLIGAGPARNIGIEIRQRDHRQHLAVIDVQNDAGGGFGLEDFHRPFHFIPKRMLDPDIKGQDKIIIPIKRVFQAVVKIVLNSAQAPAINIDITNHVREQRAMRVDALFLGLEEEPGQAQGVDLIYLLGGKFAPDPDKPPV